MDNCNFCNNEYDIKEYGNCNIKTLMKNNHICFHCAFWLEKFNLRDKNTFIID